MQTAFLIGPSDDAQSTEKRAASLRSAQAELELERDAMAQAWERKKEQLSEAVRMLLSQLQERGFASATLGSFIGALSLDSLLRLSAVEWLSAHPRAVIGVYASRLVGFDPAAQEQSERVLEQHEWMRFELAFAALSAAGEVCDQIAIERRARRLDWSAVPKSQSELVAREERAGLGYALGAGLERQRGRL